MTRRIDLNNLVEEPRIISYKTQKYRDVKHFIEGSILLNMNAQLESLQENYANEILGKLKEDI